MLGNAYHLPFSEGTFDAAFSVAVWHLLSDLPKAGGELSRVLKANAHFLIITANPGAYSVWTDLYKDTQADGRRFRGTMNLDDKSVSQDTLYLHSLDEIAQSLEAASLKIDKTETFRMSEKSGGQEYYLSIEGRKVPTNLGLRLNP